MERGSTCSSGWWAGCSETTEVLRSEELEDGPGWKGEEGRPRELGEEDADLEHWAGGDGDLGRFNDATLFERHLISLCRGRSLLLR